MNKIFTFFLTIVTTGLAQAAQSWACAVCLTGNTDGSADGYNASVLFLMATPYLVVGAIAGGLIVTYRRAQKRRQQAESAEPAIP